MTRHRSPKSKNSIMSPLFCPLFLLFLAGLFPMLCAAPALGADAWTGSGPYATGLGNRVITALAADPANLNVLYAGTGSGTVFQYVHGSSYAAPTVTTQAATAIDQTSVTGNGTITSLGSAATTAHGVCWSTAANPTVANAKTDLGAASATGAFSAAITGLASGATYHVRAYATNALGTNYGADVGFTTLAVPSVITLAVTGIGTTSAIGHWIITVLGNPNPTANGVCWSTSANPTLADARIDLGTVSITGTRTAAITGLASGATYHVRAYATNALGTVYGEDVEFTTLAVPSVVLTLAVTGIGATSAIGNWIITVLGSPNPTANGVCWSTSANPTIADAGINLGAASATGAFTAAITGLNPGTTYHVRAYATNTTGTAYGADVEFTTLKTYTINASAGTGGTVTGGGTYAYGTGVTVTVTADPGYVFMNWTEGNTIISCGAEYSLTVTADRTLTANFSASRDRYVISGEARPAEFGSVTGMGTYSHNAAVTLNALPESLSAFVHWRETWPGLQGYCVVSTEAQYAFTATRDRTLTAVMRPKTVPIPLLLLMSTD